MYNYILDYLPYKSSFRFVDEISALDAEGVVGNFTLNRDAFFYEDHFPGYPVTPGVIIIEIMAQAGLLTLGIYLALDPATAVQLTGRERLFPSLTSTEVSFFKKVLPGEKVTVISKKQYFRFGKLKCYIEMWDEANELIARGTFAGVFKKNEIKEKPL